MLSSTSSTTCLLSSGTLSLRIERSTHGRSRLMARNDCSCAQLQPLSLVGLVYSCATLQVAEPEIWAGGGVTGAHAAPNTSRATTTTARGIGCVEHSSGWRAR